MLWLATHGSTASAQDAHAFTAALIDIAELLQGDRAGSEAAIDGALRRLKTALGRWDAEIERREQQLSEPGLNPADLAARHASVAAEQFMRGRRDAALRHLAQATALDPSLTSAWLLQGEVHESAARGDEARRAYVTAFQRNPRSVVAAYHVARTAGPDSGERADAQQTLLAAHDALIGAPDGRRHQLSVLAPTFDEGRTARPVFLPDWYRTVTPLLHERDYDAALSALDQRWSTDPLRSDLASALTAPSTSSESHRLRALAYWTEAKAESAAAEMELAVRNGPWNERAHIGLVTMLARMGATERADDVLRKARAQFPASAALAWTQAAFHAALGRDHEYLPALEATLQAQPLRGVVSMWSALGRFQLRGFNLDAAGHAFRRAVSLAPNDPQGHLDLAEFLRSQGRAADALVEYVAVLLLEPDRLAAHIGIGQLHLEAGRDADAVRVMEYAVSRSPDLPEPRYALATALLRIGRMEDGKRELDAFRQLQARDIARGRRAYRVATLNLEARLREADGRYQEALALRQQVIALEPEDVGHRVSIADTLIHVRQFAEAAKQLERAAALGAPADIYLQLSQLYERLGLTEKSTAALKRYQAEGQSLRRQQGVNP